MSRTSFSLPLYPDASVLRYGEGGGHNPDDNEISQTVLEMYTLDSMDEIVLFYRRAKKKITIKDFATTEGRNIIITDSPTVVQGLRPGEKEGTTLMLYRDRREGRTRLIYTGFRAAKGD
ncbi:MAG: hypothetical protein RDV48_16675 [Candidatus Eremiobacteraeota bacterium]|nr:hypothetical protein [Candidatus Eremiobacteraeota bacterium]